MFDNCDHCKLYGMECVGCDGPWNCQYLLKMEDVTAQKGMWDTLNISETAKLIYAPSRVGDWYRKSRYETCELYHPYEDEYENDGSLAIDGCLLCQDIPENWERSIYSLKEEVLK